MDCIELVEVVTAYLDGVLPAADRQRFDAHLRECPYCEAYLEQIRVTLRALGSIPLESVGYAALERMQAAFRDWKADKP